MLNAERSSSSGTSPTRVMIEANVPADRLDA